VFFFFVDKERYNSCLHRFSGVPYLHFSFVLFFVDNMFSRELKYNFKGIICNFFSFSINILHISEFSGHNSFIILIFNGGRDEIFIIESKRFKSFLSLSFIKSNRRLVFSCLTSIDPFVLGSP